MTEIIRTTPTESTCVAQLLADMTALSVDQLHEFIKGMELEEGLPPHAAIKKHLEDHPSRVPQFAALVVMRTQYGRVLEPLEAIEGEQYFKRHAADFIECLGSVRAYICIAAILYRVGGEKLSKTYYQPTKGGIGDVDPAPAQDKVDALSKKMRDELVTVHSVMIRDATMTMKAAVERALVAEKELKDAKLKWAKVQERMVKEASRAKEKAAVEATGTAGKNAQPIIDALKKDLEAERKACEQARAELKEALQRIKDIEDQGGATPERVEAIRAEIKREADQRIEDELSIAVRPWLVRMLEMEKAKEYRQATQVLSSQALVRAKQEVAASDIIVSWEQDRERGLKALEQEMTELDSLMIRIVKPSPELCRMHSQLLEAMLTCRKQLNPAKPQGEVAKVLIAGLKKVKDEDLEEAAYAVSQLAEKGVFIGQEAETLLKIVEGEKQARYDLTHFKKSVQGRMIQRLHAGEHVDILIDGYNYMFTALQHFGDKLKLNKNADGDAVFGEAGRAKLNKLLHPVVEKFPSLDIHVFYDGMVRESRTPHPRIMLWEPTYQRAGKGQADAEITHVGLKRIRKGAMAVVVTNDKVIQRYADHYLSVRVFSDFLANH